MQLRLDAADRLVEIVEERRSPVPAPEAARALFALASQPTGVARTLLDEVVSDDARLTWVGTSVALASDPVGQTPLEAATFVVVDLETTGLSARTSEICEIGAVRVRGLAPVATFETFVAPARRAARARERADGDPGSGPARRAGSGPRRAALPLVRGGVRARRPQRALRHRVPRSRGRADDRARGSPARCSTPSTLARALLAGRGQRMGLASLSHFFGTSVDPCHRALPDAQATAEILVALIGLAQERGLSTVADLCRIAAPKARRAHDKRSLAFGAPRSPGVYLFRDRHDQVLYVGKARDLRARLRSYFRSERQRPAVEAALGAVERIEWRPLGSELEAALEELRLLRTLRPPANARGARPDRYVYLARKDERLVVSPTPTGLGPIKSRRRAELALRALNGATAEELDGLVAGAPLPRARRKLAALADDLRYEDAARQRDRIAALERVVHELRALERLRRTEACLVAPSERPGFATAFFVLGGRVASRRSIPRGAGAELEVAAGLAEAQAARGRAGRRSSRRRPTSSSSSEGSCAGPRRSSTVLPLDARRIAAACAGERLAAEVA